MRSARLIVVALVAGVLLPLSALGVAHLARRVTNGEYHVAQTSTDIPDGSPGTWNKSGVMQNRSPLGIDYIVASPFPTPVPVVSADAGVLLGSGAATKVDTCATGDTGTICYRLKDVVKVLKANGTLAP